MNAWLIYSESESRRNREYINFHMEEGKKRDIHFKLLIVERIEFGIKEGKYFFTYEGKELISPDFAICRMIYPLLTRHLEYMEVPVFNNSFVSEICNDKARTYQFVGKIRVPMVDTVFCKKEFVHEKLKMVSCPSVIKTIDGHGGTEVFLLEDHTHMDDIVTGCHGKDIVIQPLIGKTHQDLRVYVIGEEIIGAVLRTAKEGFKSNFSLGGEIRLYELTDKERKTVSRIINLFQEKAGYGFGLVGIDFIIGDHNELLFNEIEDVVGSRMLYQCTDINIVKLYLNFILEKLRD